MELAPREAIAAWRAVRHGEALPRRAAAEDLARCARSAEAESLGVATELRRGLSDVDATVRWWAAFGLGSCVSTPETIAALGAALGDAERTVRDAAAFALQFHGSAARPALGALLAALGDADAGARESAGMALLSLAPKELPNWPALRAALPHNGGELPILAQEALTWLQTSSS